MVRVFPRRACRRIGVEPSGPRGPITRRGLSARCLDRSAVRRRARPVAAVRAPSKASQPGRRPALKSAATSVRARPVARRATAVQAKAKNTAQTKAQPGPQVRAQTNAGAIRRPAGRVTLAARPAAPPRVRPSAVARPNARSRQGVAARPVVRARPAAAIRTAVVRRPGAVRPSAARTSAPPILRVRQATASFEPCSSTRSVGRPWVRHDDPRYARPTSPERVRARGTVRSPQSAGRAELTRSTTGRR